VELVTGDQQGNLCVWDLQNDSCVKKISPDGEVALRSLTIGEYSPLLAAANNRGNLFIFKLAEEDIASKCELAHKIEAHSKYLLRCMFSPDTKLLATTSADHTVKIWNVLDNDVCLDKVLTGHQRWVWDCGFSADSAYLVSASSDQTARLWDISQGETIRHYTGHTKAVSCVALDDSPT